MIPSFEDRWIAAQNAEDAARREQASAMLSGVAVTLFVGTLILVAGLIGGQI